MRKIIATLVASLIAASSANAVTTDALTLVSAKVPSSATKLTKAEAEALKAAIIAGEIVVDHTR